MFKSNKNIYDTNKMFKSNKNIYDTKYKHEIAHK